MCSLLLLLTISPQRVTSFSEYSRRAFHLCLSSSHLSYACSLIETVPRKFQGFGEWSLNLWQHKLIREYKRGKLASYFLDNTAKTCSYWLKFSENIEIKHVFQLKSFFHHSKFLQTSFHSAFNN